jgi:hypothetical protein
MRNCKEKRLREMNLPGIRGPWLLLQACIDLNREGQNAMLGFF